VDIALIVGWFEGHVWTIYINPLTPELNPSAQRSLPIFLQGILIFKGLTARRLYKSFGVKGLSCTLNRVNYTAVFVVSSQFTDVAADRCCEFLSEMFKKLSPSQVTAVRNSVYRPTDAVNKIIEVQSCPRIH
jgi:hypothetical protein